MLITSGTKGQFGNAYLSSAYHLAHALEHGYRLRLYNLGPYRDYLTGAADHPRIFIGGKAGNLAGIASGRAYRLLTRRKQTRCGPLSILNDQAGTYPLTPAELAEVATSGVAISSGWKFRDRETLKNQIAVVREILSFKSEYSGAAETKLRAIRREVSHLISIHIRMGDYRAYRGGKYCFSSEDYQRLAAEAVESTGLNPAEVAILAFSNEKLSWPDKLAGARVHQPGGSWWEDFLCLSKSDLIIGPPSTFSGSASFLGDVPWFQIKDKDTTFDSAIARPYIDSGIRS